VITEEDLKTLKTFGPFDRVIWFAGRGTEIHLRFFRTDGGPAAFSSQEIWGSSKKEAFKAAKVVLSHPDWTSYK
jgi:hypothetical protein